MAPITKTRLATNGLDRWDDSDHGLLRKEQLGSGLKDWIKSKATEFKDYWTDPDKEDHHEFWRYGVSQRGHPLVGTVQLLQL